jgi:hypothetical protein
MRANSSDEQAAIEVAAQQHMQVDARKQNHYFRTAAIFVICLLAVFVLPYIAFYARSVIPPRLRDLLFFSPGLLFPYEALVRGPTGSDLVFNHAVGKLLAFIHWGVIAAGFTWTVRRLPKRYVVIAAVATIILVGVVTHLAFWLLSLTVHIEGL